MPSELRVAAERLRKHYAVIAGSAPDKESPYAIECVPRPGERAKPPHVIFAEGGLGEDEELLARAYLAMLDAPAPSLESCVAEFEDMRATHAEMVGRLEALIRADDINGYVANKLRAIIAESAPQAASGKEKE